MNDPYGEEAPLVDMDVFSEWIIEECDDLLVLNKPGWLVCHPSKNGPMSSLVGVVGVYTGADKLHLIARLDRETSGLIIFAKRPAIARKYQMAIQARIVTKSYLAILEGQFSEQIHIDEPIAKRKPGSGLVFVKNEVSYDRTSQTAVTDFLPKATGGGFTLCEVLPETGRKHQIRVHAEYIKHRVVGDKIYGPDEALYIDFIEHGWTDKLAEKLPMKRQALHCHRYTFNFLEGPRTFTAPIQSDMVDFCRDQGIQISS